MARKKLRNGWLGWTLLLFLIAAFAYPTHVGLALTAGLGWVYCGFRFVVT